MSDEEQETYNHMLETLDETWKLTEQLTSPEISREERQQIVKELAEKSKELRPLLNTERERRLYELGRSSGYSESESETFVDYINATLKSTSMPFPQGGSRRQNTK